MRIRIRAILPALAMVALTSASLFADTAVLGIAGDATVGLNNMNFGVFPFGAPYAPAPQYGLVDFTSAPTGFLATSGMLPGEFASIQSLNSTLEPAGTMLSPAVAFMAFATGGSNLQLYLTEFNQGSQAPAGSPFTFADTTTGATDSFEVAGYVLNTNDSSQTAFTGLFTAVFTGVTVADLLGSLPVGTPFYATFELTTTPEPASILLMGVGLLSAGMIARKRVVATGPNA